MMRVERSVLLKQENNIYYMLYTLLHAGFLPF